MSSRRPDAPAGSARARWETAAQSEKLIALGVIMGSHGLQGLLRVKPYNTESDTLWNSPLLIVRSKSTATPRVHAVRSVRPADKGLFVALEGIESVEASKPLHGSELCVPRSALPALQPGEYYYSDLDGLAAVGPDGSAVGTIERVVEYPAASVLSVVTEGGTLEIPMREPYLLSVDVTGGKVVVDRIEDLDVQAPRRKAT